MLNVVMLGVVVPQNKLGRLSFGKFFQDGLTFVSKAKSLSLKWDTQGDPFELI
jgi:hypothetical protein